MLCTKWGGSIVGTCEVGLPQLTKDDGTRPVAKVERSIFPGIRRRRDRWEYLHFNAAGVGEAAAWR